MSDWKWTLDLSPIHAVYKSTGSLAKTRTEALSIIKMSKVPVPSEILSDFKKVRSVTALNSALMRLCRWGCSEKKCFVAY